MFNLFDQPQKRDPVQLTQVKQWVTARFAVPDDATVMVTELRCTEPGCPPLETVIAVLAADGTRQQWKLHHAANAITEAEIVALE